MNEQQMTFCRNCGKQIEKKESICPHCEAKTGKYYINMQNAQIAINLLTFIMVIYLTIAVANIGSSLNDINRQMQRTISNAMSGIK